MSVVQGHCKCIYSLQIVVKKTTKITLMELRHFSQVHRITAVATQGKNKLSIWALEETAWVEEYTLSFSSNGFQFSLYVVAGDIPQVYNHE